MRENVFSHNALLILQSEDLIDLHAEKPLSLNSGHIGAELCLVRCREVVPSLVHACTGPLA